MTYTTEWERSLARTRAVALGMITVAALAVGFAAGRCRGRPGPKETTFTLRIESGGPLSRAKAAAIAEGLRRDIEQEERNTEE